ncbi:MAG TPA: hypothetical protein VFM10_12610 [Terriglobales bacterium]|nr:hypothetical protein [Terriglobales bacterium]
MMLQLERNRDTLLLKNFQRRENSEDSRETNLITPLRGSARGASLASRFFDAELKTWRGEQPLWLTFWIYGAAVSGLLALLYGVAVYAATPMLQQMLLIVLSAYTAWVLISLWRCTEGAKDLSGVMARFLIVPWAANVTLVLAFMQIGFLLQVLGAG